MPLVALAALVALAGTTGEHCAALSSPGWVRQVIVPELFEREVVLAPDTLTEDDARALAKALHADLVPTGKRWRLLRLNATAAALRKADREWMRAQMDATVSRADALVRRYGGTPDEAPYQAMRAGQARFENRTSEVFDNAGSDANETTPAARLLTHILRHFPSDAFNDLVPGTSVVFSNAPLGAERPFVVESSALGAYASAQEKFAKWSEVAIADGRIPEKYRWAFAKAPFQAGSRTLQLYVNRWEAEPTFGLGIYDPSGASEANTLLVVRGPEARESARRQSLSTTLGKVSLSSETIASTARATPGSLIFQIASLDPVAHEPLDLCVRDALLLWGKAKGYDRVVACVPDALLAAVPSYVHGPTLDLDALTGAIEEAGCETLVQGRTLIVRPQHPLQEEAMRADRRPLSALCRAASRGTFGLDDLFAYHLAYADNYEFGSIVQRVERPIRDAFHLISPNWSAPHALLAVLGGLSTSERQALAKGSPVPLTSPVLTRLLLALARSAKFQNASSSSDLDRTPTRLLARSERVWIAGTPSVRTLVRQVAKGYSEFTRRDPVTRVPATERGENLVIDPTLVSLSFAAAGLPKGQAYRLLDKNYRFFWAEEHTNSVSAFFGSMAQAGPYALREHGPESTSAVDLNQVPGSSLLKSLP